MRWAFVLLACLAGQSALADDAALLDFMGEQGCTFGADSRAAATAAGFDGAEVDALIAATLAAGTAQQQRAYVVLDETICTIRLPDIQSTYTVASPEIVAITSAVDAYAADGEPGCFLGDVLLAIDVASGGDADAGFANYLSFVGAGMIAGDLRFYAPDILTTPLGLQVTAGVCADVPNIDDILRSHAFVASGFGAYIRQKGADNSCDGTISGGQATELSERMQRTEADEPINAWLWFEYDMIAMAAGWHEGMTAAERGTPRPPLCHYP